MLQEFGGFQKRRAGPTANNDGNVAGDRFVRGSAPAGRKVTKLMSHERAVQDSSRKSVQTFFNLVSGTLLVPEPVVAGLRPGRCGSGVHGTRRSRPSMAQGCHLLSLINVLCFQCLSQTCEPAASSQQPDLGFFGSIFGSTNIRVDSTTTDELGTEHRYRYLY